MCFVISIKLLVLIIDIKNKRIYGGMIMKKWNNPKLMMLGVENTEDTCNGDHYIIIDGIMPIDPSKHLCHKTGNGEHGGNDDIDVPGQGKGHPFTGNICKDHDDCCCFGLS